MAYYRTTARIRLTCFGVSGSQVLGERGRGDIPGFDRNDPPLRRIVWSNPGMLFSLQILER